MTDITGHILPFRNQEHPPETVEFDRWNGGARSHHGMRVRTTQLQYVAETDPQLWLNKSIILLAT